MDSFFEKNGVKIGLLGGLMATIGDIGQLWIVNAANPAVHFSPAPAGILVPATVLGVLGIIFYGFGYYGVAANLGKISGKTNKVLILAGLVGASFAASIHAATGVFLGLPPSPVPMPDMNPLDGIFYMGDILISLWAVGLGLVILVNLILSFSAKGMMRIVTPLTINIAIIVVSKFLPKGVAYMLAPASVNVAHLLFFALVAFGMLKYKEA